AADRPPPSSARPIRRSHARDYTCTPSLFVWCHVLLPVEHLDFLIKLGRLASRTEAAAVDRDGLDHREDLASWCEPERRPGAARHPRQQPLHAETKLDL